MFFKSGFGKCKICAYMWKLSLNKIEWFQIVYFCCVLEILQVLPLSFLHTRSVTRHSEEEFINWGNKVSQDSIVSIVIRQRAKQPRKCSIPGCSKRFFSSPKGPDQLWVTLHSFFYGKSCWYMKQTMYLYLVQRLRLSGSVPLFSHILSWHAQDHLYLVNGWEEKILFIW
jgi:hypothetical protein